MIEEITPNSIQQRRKKFRFLDLLVMTAPSNAETAAETKLSVQMAKCSSGVNPIDLTTDAIMLKTNKYHTKAFIMRMRLAATPRLLVCILTGNEVSTIARSLSYCLQVLTVSSAT
jgi:hypothetical protein